MPHIGYHGTMADFTEFSAAMFGSASDRSPNGALGIWVFTDPSYANRYGANKGGRTLRVTSGELKTIRITQPQMRQDHEAAQRADDPVAWFRRRRAGLLAEGYSRVDVVEYDGSIEMSVLIDLQAIEGVEDLAEL